MFIYLALFWKCAETEWITWGFDYWAPIGLRRLSKELRTVPTIIVSILWQTNWQQVSAFIYHLPAFFFDDEGSASFGDDVLLRRGMINVRWRLWCYWISMLLRVQGKQYHVAISSPVDWSDALNILYIYNISRDRLFIIVPPNVCILLFLIKTFQMQIKHSWIAASWNNNGRNTTKVLRVGNHNSS